MVAAVERAKWWVARKDLDIVTAHEGFLLAMAYAEECKRRRYEMSVQLDALEVKHRLHYCVGSMILLGQQARVFGSRLYPKGLSITDILGLRDHGAVNRLREPAIDTSSADFDAALQLGRNEGDLTMAHVLRILRGEERPVSQDRSEYNRGKRHLDSNKIMEALADELEATLSGIDLVVSSELDPERKKACKDSIRKSLRSIMKEVSKW